MIDSHDVAKIARHLQEAGVVWGVGASYLLQQHGILQDVQDLDLLIAGDDVDCSHQVLQRLGKGHRGMTKAPYETIHFFEYQIGLTDVDVIGRFRIAHEAGVYELLFDATSIASEVDVHGVHVPCMALEDWFVLYLLMGREEKAQLIEAYLVKNGVLRRDLLTRALEQELPQQVRERVQNL